MKISLLILSLYLIISCSKESVRQDYSSPTVSYNIDVRYHSDDLFHVTVNASNLNNNNDIYHFAATVPGTYQLLDFGRFVKKFIAFDKNGNKLDTEKLSVNDWRISSPEKLSKIEYDIEDSFDAVISEFPIPPMCGSGIENEFIAINTFAVLGYFEGLQSNPIQLKLEYNSDWEIGTALKKNEYGFYYAENYDHLADSPILIGDLSIAETFVDDMSVQVYVYSPDTSVSASKILALAENVLQSASSFIGYSPVSQYKFLMCLIDEETIARNKLYGGGALEHSYSSLYVMSASSNHLKYLESTMAHEFLHILTPLFLHSEIIHTFNFENPIPSQHIWLYESITEWASDIMQLRAGVIDMDRYMEIISGKLRRNDRFDQSVSFKEIALTSYEKSGFGNFLNFYEKGAVMASLLDLRILELSNGERGLQEVFLSLLKKYGKYKPFPENEFFNIFVQETYPEIKDFINSYIVGTEKLPYEEYYSKLGYNYVSEKISKNTRPTIGFGISMNDKLEFITIGVQDSVKEWGLKDGDVIMELFGESVSMESINGILEKLSDMEVGDAYIIKVKRGEEENIITGKLQQRMEKHVFTQVENLTEDQLRFRKLWSNNL